MKIGILTFHRADNYGAMLQCYALFEYLKLLGHVVEIIDYRNRNLEKDHEVIFKSSEWVGFLVDGHIRSFIRYIPNLIRKLHRKKLFTLFREKYLSFSEPVHGDRIPLHYDRIIIGSDQMWTIGCYKKYDPVYWGQFQHGPQCKVCGYAISSKADFLMHLSLDKVKQIIDSFDALSFRERKIAELIECITHKRFPVTIDPTLLLRDEEWNPLIDHKWSQRNYVAVYYVRGEVRSIIEDAKHFAKDNHCNVINLASNSYSIQDFVSAIKYAKAVFTSSFHATVFSIIFHKPFNAYCLKDGNDERYANLLQQLGLDGNLVDYGSAYHTPLTHNYGRIESRLDECRKESVRFIETIITAD